MSAELIRLIVRPGRDRNREPTDFPTIAFLSAVRAEKSAAEDADTAPCEYAPSAPEEL